jgi:hypothetical protein
MSGEEMTGNAMRKDPATGFMERPPEKGMRFLTAEDKKTFLELYRETWNFGKSCDAIGFNRWTVTEHLKLDPEFKKALADSREKMCDNLENKLYENAQKDRGFMDRIALLRAHRGEIYGQKATIEHVAAPKVVDSLYNALAGKEILEAEIVTDKPNIG